MSTYVLLMYCFVYSFVLCVSPMSTYVLLCTPLCISNVHLCTPCVLLCVLLCVSPMSAYVLLCTPLCPPLYFVPRLTPVYESALWSHPRLAMLSDRLNVFIQMQGSTHVRKTILTSPSSPNVLINNIVWT